MSKAFQAAIGADADQDHLAPGFQLGYARKGVDTAVYKTIGDVVNGAFTQHLVGLPPGESAELLDLLQRQASHPEYQCRFRWTPGAVAFWDNRAAQHYACSDYFPQRRVMERVSIIGDRPF